ncbi:hypothetical protein K1W69_15425 [Hoeflea sp. WL0058]|uniref:Uncharacterized protein n=1 Tax=Flavimaribacter sediminis TaxID=2865987 RepID=A0AAE3D230_9HYPH|nr:hypothetical protein [Flavimaribacter sediminis]MBW8638587.1 hypothetical protein [Flavimaribacter sediminis]
MHEKSALKTIWPDYTAGVLEGQPPPASEIVAKCSQATISATSSRGLIKLKEQADRMIFAAAPDLDRDMISSIFITISPSLYIES